MTMPGHVAREGADHVAREGADHIEVVVDRLVLEGVPPDRVHEVVTSFEQHLTALAGGDARVPVHPRPHARATVDDAAALGRHAAAEVWRSASGAIAPAGRER